jgi:hypothetical protein
VAREIQTFLQVIFAADRKAEGMDLEAVEMAARDALHRAGAAVLTQLLDGPTSPLATRVPCACGQQAQFHGLGFKPIGTVLGKAHLKPGDYVGPDCPPGQSPRDRELDVEGTGVSPGVRRRMAMVGRESSFDRGPEQLFWRAWR